MRSFRFSLVQLIGVCFASFVLGVLYSNEAWLFFNVYIRPIETYLAWFLVSAAVGMQLFMIGMWLEHKWHLRKIKKLEEKEAEKK